MEPHATRGIWHLISQGDQVIFYVTRPVSGIVRRGRVTRKFRDETPLWPSEIARGHAIWPNRFGVEIDIVLPNERREADRLDLDKVGRIVVRGFQRLGDDLAEEIVAELDSKVNTRS